MTTVILLQVYQHVCIVTRMMLELKLVLLLHILGLHHLLDVLCPRALLYAV